MTTDNTKKKNTKRSTTKNNGLKRQFFSRIKQEFHDIDYAHKLSPEEQAWLSKFMNEDLGANFTDKEDPIYTEKEDVKASYSRNNARNRDIYALQRAQGKLIYSEFEPEEEETYDPTEDLIDSLDSEEDWE